MTEQRSCKIIRIITRLNVGGPSQHVLLLTRSMQDQGCETILVSGSCEKGEADMMYLARELGVSPVMIPEMSRSLNPIRDLKALIKIYQLIKRERPDIIHMHTAKAGTLGRIASMLARQGVRIHTFHGHSLDGYFNKAVSAVFVLIERILAHGTHTIIVLTENLKSTLSRVYKIAPPEKFKVIGLGLDLAPFLKTGDVPGQELRDELGYGDETVLVGIIGRLVEIKNHKMFLDVVKQCEDTARSDHMRFVVVGDGHLKEELVGYADRLGIDDLVRFTGWYQRMDRMFDALNIIALTSLNEGTPVALIQALASARPVVSTHVGGVRSVVRDGENGFLVDTGDVEGCASRITELARDRSNRQQFGNAGRAFVREKFSGKRLVKDITQLYKDVLS